MKRIAVLIIAMTMLIFGGCAVFQSVEMTTEADSDDTTTAIALPYETTLPLLTESEGTTAALATEEQSSEAPSEEIADNTEMTATAEAERTTAADAALNAEQTTREEKTTREEQTSASEIPDEVELSISMPEKNGTMVTDSSADNKFIRIVNDNKKIDSSLLLAVYSVPESGQNYVFEFYNTDNFSADNIRRVYLIDSHGDITSVTATESSEKENISPVENWFCMNVLIKEIIYPAVSRGE